MNNLDTAAGQLIESIAPSRSRAIPAHSHPLPLARPDASASDASVLYGMGQVDSSGRISNSYITRTLGWSVDDLLDARFLPSIIVLTRNPSSGWIPISKKLHIALPTSVRNRSSIHVGDRILLAAAPDSGVLIAHPTSTLNEMMIQFHRENSTT